MIPSFKVDISLEMKKQLKMSFSDWIGDGSDSWRGDHWTLNHDDVQSCRDRAESDRVAAGFVSGARAESKRGKTI